MNMPMTESSSVHYRTVLEVAGISPDAIDQIVLALRRSSHLATGELEEIGECKYMNII